jgi:hypothetical protein
MPELSAVKEKWAVVTGGSRGLGLALARECARNGYHLFLISRSEETLRESADDLKSEWGCRVEFFSVDLSREGAEIRLSKMLQEKGIVPQMWVNNAGTASYERYTHTTPQTESEIIRLNILSLAAMTRLALKTMKQGHLINVASTAAFAPGPGAALYYASKSFVLNFTLALAYEEAEGPVKVSLLCPGPLDTEMLQKRGENGKRSAFLVMSPQKTARYALKKALKGKTIIIPGIFNKIMARCARILPPGWVIKIIGRSNLP